MRVLVVGSALAALTQVRVYTITRAADTLIVYEDAPAITQTSTGFYSAPALVHPPRPVLEEQPHRRKGLPSYTFARFAPPVILDVEARRRRTLDRDKLPRRTILAECSPRWPSGVV